MFHQIFQKGSLVMAAAIATNAMATDEIADTQRLALMVKEARPSEQVEELMIKTREAGEAMFYDCAMIAADATRLGCFDAIAVGKTPAILQQKQPIALSETIKSITGDRQLVFADDADDTTKDENVIVASENDLDKRWKAERYSPLSISYDLNQNGEQGLWGVRPHNPVYILPIYFHGKPNRDPVTPTQKAWHYTTDDQYASELKFQLSLKSKMMEDVFGTNADLWFGYTHMAHWQIYNEKNSRKFRAHDYKPEIFLTQPVLADLPFGGRLRMLGAGVVHHSNGENNPWSRSWNRAYMMAGMEWKNLTVMPRLWARIIKGGNSLRPNDNPDVLDYYGYGDVKFLYQLQSKKSISGLLRYNPKTGKGALQLDYVHPIGKGISGYVQLFQGYGQSFIDYNHEATSIGVGVMLNGWMGL
ncbi:MULTISPECIES: phospholipase A [unclassified Moraxella]|uniref:phospholipase A n=1 Tax=unclassified Moraxella TaxID=2685852 RepID=UPI002B409415|nr:MULTISPECIES: phospholipase A [unclassified Moraxella]